MKQTMNALFTMLLFLVFVLCAFLTVLIGGKTYENINARTQAQYNGSVALQYIANKVRQGDENGGISVKTIEDTPVLELAQTISDTNYITWIYYRDGHIRELFTDTESGLGLEDGLEIIECGGMNMSQHGTLLSFETLGEGGSRLTLSIRSKDSSIGGKHE